MSLDDDQLRELANQLPYDRPDDARREAVRASLLQAAAADDGKRPTWRIAAAGFVAGALAAAAALLVVVHASHAPTPAALAVPTPPAHVVASAAADFEQHVTRTASGTDELVRVYAGKVTLAVDPLPPGDHVRVATSDAEVEGQGSYEITAQSDALRAVTVTRGTAIVRVRGQQAVFLAAGQTWTAHPVTASIDLPAPAPPPAPAPAPAPAPTPAPTPTPSTSTSTKSLSRTIVHRAEVPAPSAPPPLSPSSPPPLSPSSPSAPTPAPVAATATAAVTATGSGSGSASGPPSPTPVEQHFSTGWHLLRTHHPSAAARELAAAADAGTADDPLAADARYFEAIALVEAGRKTEAERAFVAFLDHAPHSLRRGRAEVQLARLIAERGDAKSARAWFSAALDDPDPDVVRAARAGLARTPAPP